MQVWTDTWHFLTNRTVPLYVFIVVLFAALGLLIWVIIRRSQTKITQRNDKQ